MKRILHATATLVATVLNTSIAMSQTSSPLMSKPWTGYLRVMVGDTAVTALSDGTMVLVDGGCGLHGAADHRARVQRDQVRKEKSPCRT